MIVYRSDKKTFVQHVDSGQIDKIILENFISKLKRNTSEKEQDSWWNSLNFMSRILYDPEIPDNAGVAIEFQLPQSSRRIDFIVTGSDDHNGKHAIIIELKQWKSAEISEKPGIVRTALGKGIRETNHPSYQAWSYAAYLQDFNQSITDSNISVLPCAYLHNYEEDDVIRNAFYSDDISKAPVFLKHDAQKLRQFLKQHVKIGDTGEIMYVIESGKIKPSKQLASSVAGLIKGKKEFILLDEQKLVYETALALTQETSIKNVLLVEGGPGTGKSVVAINLLVECIRRGMLTQYITKNAAPRAVYESKLTGSITKTRFRALFQGSGSFIDSSQNEFDVLVVDEAHRLNARSGMFSNLGENQIKELIGAARTSVFFIDENQQVTMKDIGTKSEIIGWAKKMGAKVVHLELPSQFRCNGSDGYLAFIDHLLQIRETSNANVENINYEFKILPTPDLLFDQIESLNSIRNSARVVAGYCWDWKSKANPKAWDIEFPEFNISKQWNLSVDGSLWILQPESVKQVGCIHTCQGLELDYVGVIIGNDLIVRNNVVMVDPSKRSKMDASIKGFKSLLKSNPEIAQNKIRNIIKNTYRTLLTRGTKGCYVYITDPETREWFAWQTDATSGLG